jgi:lysophospholipase L1-like esterase
LKNTLPKVIDIIRAKHPETPILLVSRLMYAKEFGDSNEYSEDRAQYNRIHLDELQKRRDAGDKNIHFLDGMTLYGDDPSECTVDGIHATDLGFYMISRRMAPVIRRILNL